MRIDGFRVNLLQCYNEIVMVIILREFHYA